MKECPRCKNDVIQEWHAHCRICGMPVNLKEEAK